MYTAWAQQFCGAWVPTVHANNSDNEIAALLTRSLGPTPGSVEAARAPVLEVFRKLRLVGSRYSGQRWSYLETAESYTGSLRRRYVEASNSLEVDGPLRSSDYYIKGFLKAEKVNAMAKSPKPRMIFPRSPRYNLVVASRLKPFEHWLWGYLTGKRLFNGQPSRIVAKGLNQRQRANLIVRKFRSIPGCVVFEVDGRAFEAHVDRWQLERGEHPVYHAAFPGDRELQSALGHQLLNAGVTAGGVKFSREGGRASGDFNTGMGNSLIMTAVVVATLKELGCRFDVLVDGDNALVFLPPSVVSRVVEDFAATALRISGHEMVLENPVRVVEEVRFGQSAPVELDSGWQMVRDWRKVLSQGTSNHAHMHDPRFVESYLHGIALCELSLAIGVPIIGRWADNLRKNTGRGRVVHAMYKDYEYLGVDLSRLGKAVFKEPSLAARLSFARAFNTPLEVQVAVEDSLITPTFGLPWVVEDSPVAGDWWSARPGLCEPFFGYC